MCYKNIYRNKYYHTQELSRNSIDRRDPSQFPFDFFKHGKETGEIEKLIFYAHSDWLAETT